MFYSLFVSITLFSVPNEKKIHYEVMKLGKVFNTDCIKTYNKLSY